MWLPLAPAMQIYNFLHEVPAPAEVYITWRSYIFLWDSWAIRVIEQFFLRTAGWSLPALFLTKIPQPRRLHASSQLKTKSPARPHWTWRHHHHHHCGIGVGSVGGSLSTRAVFFPVILCRVECMCVCVWALLASLHPSQCNSTNYLCVLWARRRDLFHRCLALKALYLLAL